MAHFQVAFFSDVLSMASQMEVILPDELKEDIPVVYLLHGMTDNHTVWMRNTAIERYATERGLAIIMPEGHLGWYTDMQNGFDYYTYISQELPTICAKFFPHLTHKRDKTFICGNSMGGYGAMKIALRQPERFAGVASLSGAVDICSVREVNASSDKFRQNLFDDIFGENQEISGTENDLFALSSQLASAHEKTPSIYMWCGFDDFLYKDNLRFKDHLSQLGLAPEYHECEGAHEWKCWDQQIVPILDWFISIMKGC